MKTVFINGEPVEIVAGTLADALAELDYGDQTVATALNGRFVPAAQRPARPLADGDKVEIVTPRQGG
ncbi:sulfur carrier protein [Pseudoxanthobacter soli DSM 19599]|uniref:Sulfur carrier protein n=1 Tax=Pseudoxanthobacter soli DSM 19599 TaxID=1123029 RepID=A0A1M7ZQQ0_9HYPH|nr:sulfur carrier protein ThiS [Pseudoxanthobacter soli]SHO67243.1 sulfur carrier protein [Pseudoxanthobacter soli DSM 19599]